MSLLNEVREFVRGEVAGVTDMARATKASTPPPSPIPHPSPAPVTTAPAPAPDKRESEYQPLSVIRAVLRKSGFRLPEASAQAIAAARGRIASLHREALKYTASAAKAEFDRQTASLHSDRSPENLWSQSEWQDDFRRRLTGVKHDITRADGELESLLSPTRPEAAKAVRSLAEKIQIQEQQSYSECSVLYVPSRLVAVVLRVAEQFEKGRADVA